MAGRQGLPWVPGPLRHDPGDPAAGVIREGNDDIPHLASLAAELSDAHLDTIHLAQSNDLGLAWGSHIEYLQRLRRLTERALATESSGPVSALSSAVQGDMKDERLNGQREFWGLSSGNVSEGRSAWHQCL